MSVNSTDTAWLLISVALVMLMTPGVALFYGGMVRRKSVLSTMMMSFAALAVVGLIWVLYGYSLSFGPDKAGIIGGLDWVGLRQIGQGHLLSMPALFPILPSWYFKLCLP